MRGNRTYVRRERPTGLVVMAALMALGTGLFVFFAKPAVREASKTDAAPRIVSDVTLEGESVYLLALAAPSDETQARVEAARFASRGAAGYILPEGGKYYVIGSGYEEITQAEKVCEKLKSDEGLEAAALGVSQNAARLRITSSEEQLNAFTGSDAELRLASRLLREMALELDSGEIEPVQARARLQSGRARIEAALETLGSAAGDAPNAVAGKWLEMLSNAKELYDSLSRGDYKTRLYFSSALRHAFIDIRLCHIKALKDLA